MPTELIDDMVQTFFALAFPLEWFPKLQHATAEEREDWVQTDKGLHFNQLDLDVSL